MVNIPLGSLTKRQLIELLKEASEVLLAKEDDEEMDKIVISAFRKPQHKYNKGKKVDYPNKTSKLPMPKKTKQVVKKKKKKIVDNDKLDTIIKDNIDKTTTEIWKILKKHGLDISRSFIYKRKSHIKKSLKITSNKPWKLNPANTSNEPVVSAEGDVDIND